MDLRILEPVGSRALVIVLVVLGIMCGLIAWSQWYAIHVNVPLYEAKHAHAPAQSH